MMEVVIVMTILIYSEKKWNKWKFRYMNMMRMLGFEFDTGNITQNV